MVDTEWAMCYYLSVLKDTSAERGGVKMNIARLEYEMRRHNIKKSDMIVLLGISRSAFYRKCKGESEFTQSEIQRIVDILNLASPMGIFFDDKVS